MAINDLFNQLLPATWKDIQFPIVESTLEFKHDLAVHKFPDVDGARLEATGREPIRISFKAVFYNSIVPGKSEKWGVLYPDAHRKFMAACADRKSGVLVYPTFGELSCKCESFTSKLSGAARTGEEVDCVFIEDKPSPEDLFVAGRSPISNAILNAVTLDAEIGKLKSADPEPTVSFEDSMRTIVAAFDKTTLAAKKVGGLVNRVVYRLNTVYEAAVRTGDVLVWPAIQAIDALRASCNDINKQQLLQAKEVRTYITPRDMSVVDLSNVLKVKIEDLLTLNIFLANAPTVARFTAVRYYA